MRSTFASASWQRFTFCCGIHCIPPGRKDLSRAETGAIPSNKDCPFNKGRRRSAGTSISGQERTLDRCKPSPISPREINRRPAIPILLPLCAAEVDRTLGPNRRAEVDSPRCTIESGVESPQRQPNEQASLSQSSLDLRVQIYKAGLQAASLSTLQ